MTGTGTGPPEAGRDSFLRIEDDRQGLGRSIQQAAHHRRRRRRVESNVLEVVEQALQTDPQLHSSEMDPQADVGPTAEGKMATGLPKDVECLRVIPAIVSWSAEESET